MKVYIRILFVLLIAGISTTLPLTKARAQDSIRIETPAYVPGSSTAFWFHIKGEYNLTFEYPNCRMDGRGQGALSWCWRSANLWEKPTYGGMAYAVIGKTATKVAYERPTADKRTDTIRLRAITSTLNGPFKDAIRITGTINGQNVEYHVTLHTL